MIVSMKKHYQGGATSWTVTGTHHIQIRAVRALTEAEGNEI